MTPRVIPFDASYMLTAEDEREIRIAARQIRDLNEARGTVSKHWTDDTQIELDRKHAGAVVAFCRLAGIEPILVREEWIGATGKVHCYLPDGRSVSVKQTDHARGHLLVNEDEPRAADLYVLLVGAGPTYAFRGWEINTRIFVAENLTWGYGGWGSGRLSQRYHLRQLLFRNAEQPAGFLQRDLAL